MCVCKIRQFQSIMFIKLTKPKTVTTIISCCLKESWCIISDFWLHSKKKHNSWPSFLFSSGQISGQIKPLACHFPFYALQLPEPERDLNSPIVMVVLCNSQSLFSWISTLGRLLRWRREGVGQLSLVALSIFYTGSGQIRLIPLSHVCSFSSSSSSLDGFLYRRTEELLSERSWGSLPYLSSHW